MDFVGEQALSQCGLAMQCKTLVVEREGSGRVFSS